MLRVLALVFLCVGWLAPELPGQESDPPTGLELLERVVDEARKTGLSGERPLLTSPQDPANVEDPAERRTLEGEKRISSVLEIALIITLLSLAPAILLSVTSFTRIVIVLSFVRRALSVQELPPNQVVVGLALFLTLFCMAPVIGAVHDQAITPYLDGEVRLQEAGERAAKPLRTFLLANTRESDLALFAEISGREEIASPEETPLLVAVPAFVLSELKTAFQMGFLIFLPFLVIDFVVSSILLSMGMFMLPPIVISTPFKILLFVLVDGWNLVITSLVRSVALA